MIIQLGFRQIAFISEIVAIVASEDRSGDIRSVIYLNDRSTGKDRKLTSAISPGTLRRRTAKIDHPRSNASSIINK